MPRKKTITPTSATTNPPTESTPASSQVTLPVISLGSTEGNPSATSGAVSPEANPPPAFQPKIPPNPPQPSAGTDGTAVAAPTGVVTAAQSLEAETGSPTGSGEVLETPVDATPATTPATPATPATTPTANAGAERERSITVSGKRCPLMILMTPEMGTEFYEGLTKGEETLRETVDKTEYLQACFDPEKGKEYIKKRKEAQYVPRWLSE
jgi:hypothetical protein